MNKIKLSTRELRMIDQVIIVPMYAADSEELIKVTGLTYDYIDNLHKKIKILLSLNNSDRIDTEVTMPDWTDREIKDLFVVYLEAVPLAKDFDSINTLTGYEEKEVEDLAKKLSAAIKEN